MTEVIQNNRMFEIVDKITKNKDLKIVLITGPSSSGKTTTSKKLSLFMRSKGFEPIPISVDDFYTDMKDRVLDKNGKPEIERIEAFDTNQFNKKISELLDGKEVILPKYNFIEGKQEFNDKNKIKMKDNSILIIEGIHAFNEKLTEMIPSTAIIIPETLLTIISCFSLNFFLNTLMVVLRINHQKVAPPNTPQRIENILNLEVSPLVTSIPTTAKRPIIRKIAPGLVMVIKKASKKSSSLFLFPLFCLTCLRGFVR